MPMTTQDVCGTPEPQKVEWKYLKNKKGKIIRRIMNKVVKEEKELEETVDMNNQKNIQFSKARRLWSMLIGAGKVYPTDYEGLITFEKFYERFIKQYNKEPTLDDIMKKFVAQRYK